MQIRKLIITSLIFLVLWVPVMSKENHFKIRGVLPWHNFLSGPTAWNENDYKVYLDRMQELNLNFIGFHCYTGGAERYASYVEPMIKIQYRNTVPEAGFDTGITARWGYRPLLLKDYAFETGKLFPQHQSYYGADCAVSAASNQERYEKAQTLMRRVMEMAHERDIKFGMGFEFGVYPPEFASVAPQDYRIPGTMLPDPTHHCSVEILQLTIDDILSAYPDIDYVWLWLHELTCYVAQPTLAGDFKNLFDEKSHYFADAQSKDAAITGVWCLEFIEQAYTYIKKKAPDVNVVIGGWGGGDQLPAILSGLDLALPKDIVFSCLNPNQGWSPQLDILSEITQNRDVWAIPWLEGDRKLWHMQPRVKLMHDQVSRAHQHNLDGVVAIHWRTAETRQNLNAFATYAGCPKNPPSIKEIYQKDCENWFGKKAASELVPLLVKMDVQQWLNEPTSPEFYPYHPGWGRISPELETKLNDLARIVQSHSDNTSNKFFKQNLDWLSSNIMFTILLDKVGKNMEPAFELKKQYYTGKCEIPDKDEIFKAKTKLASAPVKELFDTFKNRELDRGELGVLSSVNQRLWQQYRDLNDFIEFIEMQ